MALSLNHTDPKLTEALATLSVNRDFKVLVEFLKESLEYSKQSLVDAHDMDCIRKLQGSAGDLEELIKMIEEAPRIVARSRKG